MKYKEQFHMRNFRKIPFPEIAATAPPERVVLFYIQIARR